MLIIGNVDSVLLFGVVHTVIAININDYYFAVNKLDTIEYNDHMHSYEVQFTSEYEVIKPIDLLDYHPLSLYCVKLRYYIPLKYHIEF